MVKLIVEDVIELVSLGAFGAFVLFFASALTA
jgi:hypothetical protein